MLVFLNKIDVGKSSLLLQFLENRYRGDYEATIGVEFGSRILDIADSKIKVQIWDTVFDD